MRLAATSPGAVARPTPCSSCSGRAGLLIASLIASSDSIGEADAAADLAGLLDWLDPIWRVAYVMTAILIAALIAVAFATKRRALGLTLVVTVLLVVGVSEIVARVVEGEWADLGCPVHDAATRPSPPCASPVATAVVAVARPDLSRPMRRFGSAVVVVGTLAAIVLGESSLSGALAAASVGVLVAAAIFLVVGSHAGFPPERRVRASLAELGLAVGTLEPTAEQTAGVATYAATDTAGRELLVKVYGRDARDWQFLARVWRTMWYRDAGRQIATSRVRQVEHEALCTLAARRAGSGDAGRRRSRPREQWRCRDRARESGWSDPRGHAGRLHHRRSARAGVDRHRSAA